MRNAGDAPWEDRHVTVWASSTAARRPAKPPPTINTSCRIMASATGKAEHQEDAKQDQPNALQHQNSHRSRRTPKSSTIVRTPYTRGRPVEHGQAKQYAVACANSMDVLAIPPETDWPATSRHQLQRHRRSAVRRSGDGISRRTRHVLPCQAIDQTWHGTMPDADEQDAGRLWRTIGD